MCMNRLSSAFSQLATMAPITPEQVKLQTYNIIECLFDDDDGADSRGFSRSESLEVDGPEDDFDPVLIADKLRTIADSLNEDAAFKAALAGMKQAVVNEAAEAAFGNGVEALCQSPVIQRAEVAPEVQLIRASVAFGLYIKNSCPELKSRVQNAMAAFLNRRVGSWVAENGGWNKVSAI